MLVPRKSKILKKHKVNFKMTKQVNRIIILIQKIKKISQNKRKFKKKIKIKKLIKMKKINKSSRKMNKLIRFQKE